MCSEKTEDVLLQLVKNWEKKQKYCLHILVQWKNEQAYQRQGGELSHAGSEHSPLSILYLLSNYQLKRLSSESFGDIRYETLLLYV